MNKELNEIREKLIEIAEREATKLFRIARRLENHGGTLETIKKIREEAFKLHTTAYPERLVNSDMKWHYAFK